MIIYFDEKTQLLSCPIGEGENTLEWWGRWDSNPRPPAPQADILPS